MKESAPNKLVIPPPERSTQLTETSLTWRQKPLQEKNSFVFISSIQKTGNSPLNHLKEEEISSHKEAMDNGVQSKLEAKIKQQGLP